MASSIELEEDLPSRILYKLTIPMFLVDEAGSIIYANAAADAVLGANGVFERVGGTLSTRNHSDIARLHLAIAKVSTTGVRETIMMEDAGSNTILLVSLVALLKESLRKDVLITVQKRDVQDETFTATLRQLFRLSPGEIAIAAALVSGADPQHIAEQRGAKVSTVRTQIVTIMMKTHTSRQGQLIPLLTRIASLP